jgi:hypothetical protein
MARGSLGTEVGAGELGQDRLAIFAGQLGELPLELCTAVPLVQNRHRDVGHRDVGERGLDEPLDRIGFTRRIDQLFGGAGRVDDDRQGRRVSGGGIRGRGGLGRSGPTRPRDRPDGGPGRPDDR